MSITIETIRHQMEVDFEEATQTGELAYHNEYAYRLQQMQVQASLLQTEAIEKVVIQLNMLATTLAQLVQEKM